MSANSAALAAALRTGARVQFEAKVLEPGPGLPLRRDRRATASRAATIPGVRPNQIFAVGGLPLVLLTPTHARAVVSCVEGELLTPVGLRTLARGEPGYCGRYEGSPASRDGAYHQGTVWPWLLGPFVEAWTRVGGDDAAARTAARERFLAPLLAGLPESAAGIGHLPEIADGDAPHTPRGCPFQAWSMGELTRLALGVLK